MFLIKSYRKMHRKHNMQQFQSIFKANFLQNVFIKSSYLHIYNYLNFHHTGRKSCASKYLFISFRKVAFYKQSAFIYSLQPKITCNECTMDNDQINYTHNSSKSTIEDDTMLQIINYVYFLGLPLIGLMAVLGNALVLYAAYGSRNFGRLHIFDVVIKSLAWTDLLLGLIGIPSQILGVYIQSIY